MPAAKSRELQLEKLPRTSDARAAGALVPAGIRALPIEPPHPKVVRNKLVFTTSSSYRKAVLLADRYYWQSLLAVERREASVKKYTRQAQSDHLQTQETYQRQVAAAQQRYRSYLEQAHAKHRHAISHARAGARPAEDVYRAVLEQVPGYGELQLDALSLADVRAITIALVQGYRSALGPDGLGDLTAFLRAFDRVLDHAKDRRMVVPIQLAELIIKGALQRQVRHLMLQSGKDPETRIECERLKESASLRLGAIGEFLAECAMDKTPSSIRATYFAVHDWLGKAPGSPFDLALDRLKLDVEATSRREQRSLEDQMKVAIQTCAQAPQIRPAAEAFQAAQRILATAEQAARNTLQSDLVKIESALERELQMADAIVVGMEHKQSKRLAQAKRDLIKAKKLNRRWYDVLTGLQIVSGWVRIRWRLLEGFDIEHFWNDLRAKQAVR
ncbi:MAG: hypothetical protein VKN33_07170 [Candidatus Sericytochromatia bacterium]|nr:hypothetical protein [Candidatus Sericytochromatia bacterium]